MDVRPRRKQAASVSVACAQPRAPTEAQIRSGYQHGITEDDRAAAEEARGRAEVALHEGVTVHVHSGMLFGGLREYGRLVQVSHPRCASRFKFGAEPWVAVEAAEGRSERERECRVGPLTFLSLILTVSWQLQIAVGPDASTQQMYHIWYRTWFLYNILVHLLSTPR